MTLWKWVLRRPPSLKPRRWCTCAWSRKPTGKPFPTSSPLWTPTLSSLKFGKGEICTSEFVPKALFHTRARLWVIPRFFPRGSPKSISRCSCCRTGSLDGWYFNRWKLMVIFLFPLVWISAPSWTPKWNHCGLCLIMKRQVEVEWVSFLKMEMVSLYYACANVSFSLKYLLWWEGLNMDH